MEDKYRCRNQSGPDFKRKNRFRWSVLPGVTGLAVLMALSAGCGRGEVRGAGASGEQQAEKAPASDYRVPGFEAQESTQILFGQEGIEVEGKAADSVEVEKNRITITGEGTYLVSGVLEEGQLRVDADGDDRVLLVLAGLEITNRLEAPLYVKNAGLTGLFLAEGTENRIRSGPEEITERLEKNDDFTDSVDEDSVRDAEGAAVYAKDNLSVMGAGSLKVTGGINNGIHTSNHLVIEGGIIEVRALNHGIKGKDSVSINGGSFSIFSGRDGIRSDDDAGEGYGEVSISGGSFVIRSGQNGVRARTALTISGGSLKVAKSQEGLEANQLTISGGMVDITAQDDGINANGEPAPNMPSLVISGGEVHVNAMGDGLDSNGNLFIQGGVTVIDGPESDRDGPLDYGHENGGACLVNGGTILAIGSSGMAETFGDASAQCSFRHIFETPYHEGAEISISDSEGTALIEYRALKKGSSVVFSSPELAIGEEYCLEAGEEKVYITMNEVSVSSGSMRPFR